jgi:cytochrome d ubiquinol oxidase subunit I
MLEAFDAVTLARFQFAFTVAFHFIFPSLSIGLASYLAVLNGLWLRTRDTVYLDLFRFWVKIFAIIFAMGVVSGITMSYQFGTNWSVFSDRAGPVIGPLMAYEVLTAFFLEAGFLGIMLFGREKVGERLHMLACAMVAIGTAVSATWILSVNSWMQTPAGFSIAENGQFVPEDWWADHLQPQLPLPPGAHADGVLPDHGLHGRRRWRPGTSSAVGSITRGYGACSPWPCGWPRWWRRCRCSSATCTGSTRWSTSR